METAVKTTWGIDTAHSEVQFKVKHMMVSTVTGYFNEFDGSVESEAEDFEGATIKFTANIDSIDTRNEQRDAHLKSDDFFNAEAFPQMVFESTSFSKKENGNFHMTGNMTIRDITKEIEMDVEYNGSAVDPYGNTKAGFEINGKISRKAFGLMWNAVTEAGSIVVSDEVRLNINVQLIKQ
jgi:polyisoprenoid-binding protein YceI